jgi:hypothetical protein
MEEILGHSLVLGFIAGTLLSLIFYLMVNTASLSKATTVNQTIILYQKEVYIQKPQQSQDSGVPMDGLSIGIFYGGIALFATWGYLTFSEQIFLWTNVFTITSFCFGLSIIIISLIKKMVTDLTWLVYLGIPFLAMSFSLVLINELQENLDPELVRSAEQTKLLDFISFLYHNLTGEEVLFYGTQACALFFTIFFQFICVICFMHYVALLNFRGDKYKSFWNWLIKITRRPLFGAPWKNLLFLFIVGLAAHLFVSGKIVEFLMRNMIK